MPPLNIPECQITDSLLSLYIFDTVSRHETITESISICITDPYSCVCQLVRMCACACVCACVCVCVCVHTSVYTYAHVSSSTRYTAVVVHSSLVIFDEHLVW